MQGIDMVSFVILVSSMSSMWKQFLRFSRKEVTTEACKWWFHLYGLCREHTAEAGETLQNNFENLALSIAKFCR